MTDYQSPPLRISARRAGHARAGMFHAAAAVLHAAGAFSLGQVQALKRDPELIVDEVGADGVIHFDAEKFEAQLKSHFGQDPFGVAAVLQRVFPGLSRARTVETFVSQVGAGGTPGSASVSTEELPLDPGTATLGPNGEMPAVLATVPAAIGMTAERLGDVLSDVEGAIGLPLRAGALSGVEQGSARQGHSLEVGGSSPPPASTASAGAPPPPPPAAADADVAATADAAAKTGKGKGAAA